MASEDDDHHHHQLHDDEDSKESVAKSQSNLSEECQNIFYKAPEQHRSPDSKQGALPPTHDKTLVDSQMMSTDQKNFNNKFFSDNKDQVSQIKQFNVNQLDIDSRSANSPNQFKINNTPHEAGESAEKAKRLEKTALSPIAAPYSSTPENKKLPQPEQEFQ